MSSPVFQTLNDGAPEQAGTLPDMPDDEDKVLDYTLRQRQAIIVSMTGVRGEDLKDLSPREMDVVLSALDGMDRVALGRKRLRTENIAMANQAAAAAVIARVLGTPGVGQAGVSLDHQSRAQPIPIPVLPASLPDPVLVPGETDLESVPMNVDSFMAGFGPAA